MGSRQQQPDRDVKAGPFNGNIASVLLEAIASGRDPHYLECDGRSATRKEFLAEVARCQAQYRQLGIEPACRVLVAGGRGPAVWADIIALWGLGAVAVPLEAEAPWMHLEVVLALAKPALALGTFAEADRLAEANVPAVNDDSLDDAVSVEPEARTMNPGDPAAILFTSGSTGQPKGVLLTHASLLGNARATQEVLGVDPMDRLFMAIPFRFVSAVSHFLVTTLAGASIVASEGRLLPGDYCQAVIDSGANCVGGSPLQARWLAEGARQKHFDLRWMMSSGDHLPPDVIEILRERLPQTTVFVVYGLTEVGGRFCIMPPAMIDEKRGSVGHPIPGMKVEVLDENLEPVAPMELGEVHANGDYVFAGYIGDEEITADSLSEHGFRTGDVGYLDEEGWLYLRGRSDDVFKSSGEKVSALAISEVLMRTGMFEEVAIVAEDQPVVGKIAHVCYVPKKGVSFSKERVLTAVLAALPRNHMPRKFTAVDQIPRTGSGKVRQRELKLLLQGEA